MHPEADALLDAIFDHPDDDTPRLVHADWLQEHGQGNYAQFIRLQCAAGRERLWSDEANRLWGEIGRVWNRLDREWRPATRDEWLTKSWPATLDAVHFERGFLAPAIPMTYSQLVEYGRSCWPWLPLPFTTLVPDYDAEQEIVALPRLSRIRHLCLTKWRDDHQIWPLLDSALLSNLEMLDLTQGTVSTGEVEGMLRPGLYPRLRELRLKVFDEDKYMVCVSGEPDAELARLSPRMQDLRRRVQARFEKVVWLTTP